MRYFGGKQRISKTLSYFLNNLLEPKQPFVDAFCGSCNVISKIDSNRARFANDNHYELMEMWKSLQNGWEPPSSVSEKEYYETKEQGSPEERSFVGFGCSYSGKYWGGYARGGESRNYALNAFNSTMKKMETLEDVTFSHGSYKDLEIPEEALVYCDIPYKNTAGYSTGDFNHQEFYQWAKETPNVVISEYSMNVPDDAVIIWSVGSKKDIRDSEGVQQKTQEVVFTFDRNIVDKVKERIENA